MNREWEKADIHFPICVENVGESNSFLRCFYDALSTGLKLGWNVSPVRIGTVIFVGWSNFGKMWLSYKSKGKINYIHIETETEEMHQNVLNALEYSKTHFKEKKGYVVKVELRNKYSFAKMCNRNILIQNEQDNSEKGAEIFFTIKAFGNYDFKYISVQKATMVKYLLCLFTNRDIELKSITNSNDDIEFIENSWQGNNENFIENTHINENSQYVLSLDFFILVRIILDSDIVDTRLIHILNSARILYQVRIMIEDIFTGRKIPDPGWTDMIDTMAISALEPLLYLNNVNIETCESCGQLKYSIRKRIINLCKEYLGEWTVKEIDQFYFRRSKFLHEGIPNTGEIYVGTSIPLIDPLKGNEILFPVSMINFTLYELVAFTVRSVIHDNIIDLTDVHEKIDR